MQTHIIKGATIQEKREILSNNKGGFFSVTWIKKDGTETSRTLKEWANKGLASGTNEIVQENPAAHNPDNFTAYDEEKFKANKYPWVNITLSRMTRAKVGGVEYIFQESDV